MAWPLKRRVAGGVSAPGPHRSGREPLDSSGSCRPVIDGAFWPRFSRFSTLAGWARVTEAALPFQG